MGIDTVEAVRLVIWDLDETFWHGTLTEGGIAYQQHIHDMVVELATRGIVSTICSKNDALPVQKILQEHGLWDYFVMPSINWEPKGQRIAQLIENFQLRAPTILFIDDNPMNLQEALHYVPGLQVADETVIPTLLGDVRFRGKDDRKLTRLAQYRLLGQRQAEQAATGGDNVAFLRSSGIRIEIEVDVLRHIDRAIELINRTNQLNFTKQRLPDDMDEARAAFRAMVSSYDVLCGLIRVTDNYGDYGFCGFYMTQTVHAGKRLRHFCFSCRILNMGVETWLYRYLDRPKLKIVGEVIGTVDGDEAIDWITHGPAAALQAPVTVDLGGVFVHGGCDLAAVSHYFGMVSRRVTGRCNEVRGGVDHRFDHSQFLAYASLGLSGDQIAACQLLGYHPTDFQASLLADATEAKVWVLSFWADADFALYRHKASGLLIPFRVPVPMPRSGHADLTRLDPKALDGRPAQPWVKQALLHLQRDFTFAGPITQELFLENARRLISIAAPDASIFILGANEQGLPGAGRPSPALEAHRILNRWTAQICEEFANVQMIGIRDFVRDENEIHQVNHFDRMVYYRIYEHVLSVVTQRQSGGAAVVEQGVAA